MKKIALTLVAALVLSVGAPVMAAEVSLSGSLESNIEWNQKAYDDVKKNFTADSSIGVDLGIGGEQNGVSAHIELSPSVDQDSDFVTGFPGGDLSIDKAWLETNGSLWNGGQELNTRIGTLDVQHSDMVGTVDKNGVSVDGLKMGPTTIGGFMAWNDKTWTEAERMVDRGINVQADLGIGTAKATVVKTDNVDYAVEGNIAPFDGVTVDGLYAAEKDGENVANIYKVDAAVTPAENVKVTVGYRDLMDGVGTVLPTDDATKVMPGTFAPMYYNVTTDDDDNRTDLIGVANGLGDGIAADQNAGYNFGIETTQGGLTMNAGYDNPRHEAEMGVKTEMAGYKLGAQSTLTEDSATFTHKETELTAEKDFDVQGTAINGKYTATIAGSENLSLEHKLEATAKPNVAQLQGLELNGEVKVNADDTTWKAGAKYTAPNGIELGTEYDSVNGANVNAGVKVEF